MAQIQKWQSYPEMGFRVDGKGIAYDLTTNQPMAKAEVNARLSQEGSGISNLDTKHGGIQRVYDANKQFINPIAEIGLGLIPGVGPGLAAAYGAATGANSLKNPNLKGALGGAVSGYGLGKVGGSLAKAGGAASAAGGLFTKKGATTAAASLLGQRMGADPAAATPGEDPGFYTPESAMNDIPPADPTLGGLIKTAGTNLVKSGTKALTGAVKNAVSGTGATGADWLKTGGAAVDAALRYKQEQAALEEKKNQFARTQGQSEAKDAVGAQNLINRAPMADNAQALLMARMGSAPQAFAPRDPTRGPISQATMGTPATGGPATQLAAGQAAAANYKPGQGGVDTSVLELLKQKMMASSGMRA